jgi:hypothetical protein
MTAGWRVDADLVELHDGAALSVRLVSTGKGRPITSFCVMFLIDELVPLAAASRTALDGRRPQP